MKVKNNLTLNEINNKVSFFWLKNTIRQSFRLLGRILEFFNRDILFSKQIMN